MDRRAFCVSSAAGVLAAAALGVPAATRAAVGATPSPFDQVLVDSRFAEGRAFAASAFRAGSTTLTFRGDLTAVWLGRLQPHWADAGGPLAGLTTVAGLFCLEQLAKDHWLRVVARLRVGATVDRGAAGWSDRLLSSLAARTPDPAARARRVATPACAELVAWVIAKS
jgi:hypothetical protein